MYEKLTLFKSDGGLIGLFKIPDCQKDMNGLEEKVNCIVIE